jgi:hypothetical protein
MGKEIIRRLIEQDASLENLSRVWFFPLWLSDMSRLEKVAKSHPRDSVLFSFRTMSVSFFPYLEDPGIFAGGKVPTEETTLKNSKRPRDATQPRRADDQRRSEIAKEGALQREGEHCVLTEHGRSTLHVAHIIPFKLHASPREDTWDWLRFFWESDRLNE